jgi:hypothetical protein
MGGFDSGETTALADSLMVIDVESHTTGATSAAPEGRRAFALRGQSAGGTVAELRAGLTC